jgi:Flp pilus assembly protein TadG
MIHVRPKQRGEEGASLVEFALIAPILFLILFGLIDFGFIYNDFLSVRQGVRDGARAGAVANFGPQDASGNWTRTSCSNTAYIPTTFPSNEAKSLICTTRDKIGLDTSKMRIALCLASTTNAGTCSTTTATDYKDGNTLVVCAMYPATSRSGFLNPFLGNGVVTTRVAIRIEQTGVEQQRVATDDLISTTTPTAYETPLTGKNWNFCVP